MIEKRELIFTMQADGTGVRLLTFAARIQSDAAVRQAGLVSLPFASSSEHVELVYIRVRRPDGTITETPSTEAIEMPAPVTTAAPFYSDLKQLQIPVRNLRVGDSLEWQAKFVQTRAEAPGQFWGAEFFLPDTVILDEAIELRVPTSISVNVFSPSIKPIESTNSSEHIYRWQSSQTLPTVGPEAEAENERKKKQVLTEAEELDQREGKLPTIAWSTFKNWEAVGDWYRSLEADRILPDAEVKAKVAEITAGKTTQEEKVRAIYSYVSTQIRYIGVAFGIGRYQPHHASEVLQNQYGDCKDKHTLLAAMLDVIGVHSDAVLIGAGIRFNPSLPSPEAFNHLITKVSLEGRPIWLDSTAEVAPFEVLNYSIRDKSALVIPAPIQELAHSSTAERNKPDIERTPAKLPFPATQVMQADGSLDSTGTSNSRLSIAVRGDTELVLRGAFHQVSPGQYDQLVQQIAHGMGYVGTTSHADVSRPEDTAAPIKFSYDYKREKSGDWDNLRIIPQLAPVDIPRPDDKDPPIESIFLGPVRTELSNSSMKLPDGWKAELPEAVHAKSPYATYDQTYRFENGTLFSERTIQVLKERVPVSDWKTYKKFADDADLGNETFVQLTGKSNGSSSKSTSEPAKSESGDLARLNDSPKLIRAAISAIQRHDLEEARSLLDSAKHDNADQPSLWSTYGFLELARYQLPAAVEDFQKEIALHPGAFQAYGPLAQTQRSLDQPKEAAETLEKWEDLQQDNPQPAIQLGNMLMADDNPAGAAAAAESGIARLPETQRNNEALQLILGSAQLKAGMTEKGHAILLALLKTTENQQTMNDCAYDLADADLELPADEAAARSALTKMTEQSNSWTLDENPQTLQFKSNSIEATWDTLGWILFREGKLDEARQYIHAAWLNNLSSEGAEHLAEIASKQGRKDEALRYFELAVATIPTHDIMGVRIKPSARLTRLNARVQALRDQGAKSSLPSPPSRPVLTPPSKPDPSTDSRHGTQTKLLISNSESAAHLALQKIRTITLGPSSGLDGTAEFRLLLTRGKIMKAEAIPKSSLNGQSDTKPAAQQMIGAEPRLQKADLSQYFPKGSEASLVHTAMLNCHANQCELVFEP